MVGRALLRPRTHIGLFVTAVFLSAAPFATAYADKVMRVGMTASDIPTTGGIPNNGGEGFRFLGYPAYDALVNWDFKHTDQTADVTPGLATSWEVDEADRTRWIFHLRKGVKFHDGSDFNADAVVFTLGRVYDDKSPQFDAQASPIVRSIVSMLKSWEKLDDYTIAINTTVPFSHFPYLVPRILIVSPTAWEKAGRSWTEFAKAPAGTGPFKITKVMPRVSVEMARKPGLLGQRPYPEARPHDRDADAGGQYPSRGLARRPGRLDRGAAGRYDRQPQIGRIPDQPVAVSAHLAVRPQHDRQLAIP